MKDYLDTPLLDLGGGTPVTDRDFIQNILVTGVTGGGKSSGPGAPILTTRARSTRAASSAALNLRKAREVIER